MFSKYKSIPNLLRINTLNAPIISMASDSYASQRTSFTRELEKYNTSYGAVRSSTFVIQQDSLALPYLINNENAKEHLLHPLHFAIIKAGRNDYVNRSCMDAFEICYTISGQGYMEYEDEVYILKSGTGYFIDGKRHHYYRTDGEEWCKIVLQFAGANAQHYYETYIAAGSATFTLEQCPNIEIYLTEIAKASQNVIPNGEYMTANYISMLLTDLIMGINRFKKTTQTHNTVSLVISYFQEHLDEEISLDDLSRKYSISSTQLAQDFKRYAGYPPIKYLTLLRIKKAKMLLMNTSDSIEVISEKCGFNDCSHFIQIYKKYTGHTPGTERKNLSL